MTTLEDMVHQRYGTSKTWYLEDMVPRRHGTPPEGGASEKLHTTKTARFCGRVLFGCESNRFTSEKLFETKTLVLVFKVDFNPKPRFGG